MTDKQDLIARFHNASEMGTSGVTAAALGGDASVPAPSTAAVLPNG